jgi:hypothetical protein
MDRLTDTTFKSSVLVFRMESNELEMMQYGMPNIIEHVLGVYHPHPVKWH